MLLSTVLMIDPDNKESKQTEVRLKDTLSRSLSLSHSLLALPQERRQGSENKFCWSSAADGLSYLPTYQLTWCPINIQRVAGFAIVPLEQTERVPQCKAKIIR